MSERIAAIQLDLNGKIITIINVYAPTSTRVTKDSTELEEIYEHLDNLLKEFKNKTSIIICGDFNARVGRKENSDSNSVGNYSTGKRNSSGEYLVNFCELNGLIISNTCFKHRACHITTWKGQKKTSSGEIVPIFNQIDYVICDQKLKKFLTNSRSYNGTLTFTDHRLVISKFQIEWRKLWANKTSIAHDKKFYTSKLIDNENDLSEYNETLKSSINLKSNHNRKHISWEDLKDLIKTSAASTIGYQNDSIQDKANNTPDPIIQTLSEEQRKIRLRIENCLNTEEKTELKTKRNKIINQIHKQIKNNRNKDLDRIANEINCLPDHTKVFKATKLINKKRNENLQIKTNDGKFITNPNEIQTSIHDYFKQKFRDENTPDLNPFIGNPKSLKNPISEAEVRFALKRLNNNRACGEDGLPGELLKYGTEAIAGTIAIILNDIFSSHTDIKINNGNIITLQKPGKPKGPVANLRPVTLLNTIRKTLSLIVLERTRENIDRFLAPSQSGFRKGRSTADIVWAHKWIISKALQQDVKIFITGIDMSSAFDTIKRHTLLTILSDILEEDELRIIRYLLSKTNLSINVKGATEDKTFLSNIGTPQGDSLSPVLFNVYLENALRHARPPTSLEFPAELSYADDVDFVSLTSFMDVDYVQKQLSNFNLNVNTSKTEFTLIERNGNSSWKHIKKLGSLLGDKEDIIRRKQLSNAALFKLKEIWSREAKIKSEIRINIYRALVKSILLYNSSTWALTKEDETKLDTFHRKQLRMINNIKYPTIISNKSLYLKTKEIPLSLTILESRWRLFGHILRQPRNTPGNQAMLTFFKTDGKIFNGRPKTSLVTTLKQDLKRTKLLNLKLNNIDDLEQLRDVAYNRREWKFITQEMYRAAQVEKSDDFLTDGPELN